MTPYYEDDAVTIYHGDNREVLPGLSGVGQVLTSPPYNTGWELEKATGRPYQSVGPRRPSLEAAGLLVKAQGVRRTNARGNAEQVYRITADGLRAAARLLEVAA